MFRFRPYPMPGPVPVLAGCLALLACASPPGKIAPPPPVEQISIELTSCDASRVGVIVRPWTAYVRPGTMLRWTTPGAADSVAIEAVHDDWVFPAWENRPENVPSPHPPRRRRSAAGGQAVQAGTVPGNTPLGQSYRYRILIHCAGVPVIDLDPDIIIF